MSYETEDNVDDLLESMVQALRLKFMNQFIEEMAHEKYENLGETSQNATLVSLGDVLEAASTSTNDKQQEAKGIRTMDLSHMTRGQLEKKVTELMSELESSHDVNVKREGTQIILPPGMSYDEAAKWCQRKKQEDETVIEVMHTIQAHPLDGALALLKAIQRKYGWSELRPTPGFFGPKPPLMITMQTGPGEDDNVQVPWGKIAVPGIEGILSVGWDTADNTPVFTVGGQIKQGSKDDFLKLARAAEHIVNKESVYHHKAVSIKLGWKREGRDFDPRMDGFKFMDVSTVDPKQLIFDQTTESLLNVTLFSFLEHAEKFRKHHIPLKRGILLEGPYGVGKTLTAYVTAHKAVTNGYTFILVEDARDLDQVIHMARRYQPAVIFVEDIDRVVTLSRDINVDAFLNTIDGIQSKDSEIILVMTTNHVENIHRAMLRPGRLDAVISLQPPDAVAVDRLIKWYAQDMLAADVDLRQVSDRLAGHIPATIREVVERAKGIALVRTTVAGQTDGIITTEDMQLSTEGMARHMELMKEPTKVVTPFEMLGTALAQGMAPSLLQVAKAVSDDGIEEHLENASH